jgi:hypothetical protein
VQTRRELEARIRELESELAKARAAAGIRGVRYRSRFEFAGLPLLAVATGPDPSRGDRRGHARGIVAIGDVATGVLAIGGVAQGLLAFGGAALGLVSFGGLSVGALAAAGGLAIGTVAVGGGAVGWTAIGGGAVGTYACGGGAFGEHVVDAMRQDAEAVAHFARHGLGSVCPPGPRARRAR